MFRENGAVLENRMVAPAHYILKIKSDRISRNAKPGQFVQILCDDDYDPLLPRPFSFLTATPKDFSVLYQVVGKGTKILSQMKKGDTLCVVGPLGNGFNVSSSRRRGSADSRLRGNDIILLVGGGVGIPPLYHLAQVLLKNKTVRKENIHVFLGARDKSLLLCEKEFKKLGVVIHIATDNGSKGKKALVTEILKYFLGHPQSTVRHARSIFTCGPTPMMKAVSMLAQTYEVPCQASVEVPMACGFGACLGCAVKIKHQNEYRYALACQEGPVFHGDEMIWE